MEWSKDKKIHKNMNEINENLTLENSLMVDVRNPDEFAAGHDDRSINIPIGQIIGGKLDEIKNSPKENIVFVCASGGRAELAKVIAQDAIPGKAMYNLYGWENLKNIK